MRPARDDRPNGDRPVPRGAHSASLGATLTLAGAARRDRHQRGAPRISQRSLAMPFREERHARLGRGGGTVSCFPLPSSDAR
jgi:hypothetical protein